MKIMTIGLGVIGTIYAYCFQKAGHTVEHFVRDDKRDTCPQQLNIELLDGRYEKTGRNITDIYPIKLASPNSFYDFIFISVPSGKLEEAIQTLVKNNIQGTLVIACGIWEDKNDLNKILNGWEYILSYPVAGGCLSDNTLNCVLFNHIMLERQEQTNITNYNSLLELFKSADIKIEHPYDMLEWIWLHMAINAAVITTAGKYGSISNTAQSAEKAMDSPRILAEVVRTIRETTKIISSRGVNPKNYQNELWAYKIPSPIAGLIMTKMFHNNELTRRIMLLHSNVYDLAFVCKSVYECGRTNQVKAPLFFQNYDETIKKLNN